MAVKRKPKRWQAVAAAGFMAACGAGAVGWLVTGCGSDWDPLDPFKRNAPEVDQALQMLDAGQHESAEKVLSEYLGTGPCSEDGLSLPDRVRQRPNGSFDLGLTLFHLAEQYGRRFGEEEADGEDEPIDEEEAAQRSLEIDCALIVAGAIANDPKVDVGLRARAHYLAGNLEFLRKNYEQAIRHYDQALRLIPGIVEEAGGDGIGRDAAHNRAIALRRLQDQQDAGADGGEDAGDDASDGSNEPDGSDPNSEGDAGPDGGGEQDGGEDGGGPDGGEQDQGDEGEDAGDQGQPPPDPEEQEEPARPEESEEPPEEAPQPGADQDERLLDEFEEAPTYQEQEARRRARSRLRSMEDK